MGIEGLGVLFRLRIKEKTPQAANKEVPIVHELKQSGYTDIVSLGCVIDAVLKSKNPKIGSEITTSLINAGITLQEKRGNKKKESAKENALLSEKTKEVLAKNNIDTSFLKPSKSEDQSKTKSQTPITINFSSTEKIKNIEEEEKNLKELKDAFNSVADNTKENILIEDTTKQIQDKIMEKENIIQKIKSEIGINFRLNIPEDQIKQAFEAYKEYFLENLKDKNQKTVKADPCLEFLNKEVILAEKLERARREPEKHEQDAWFEILGKRVEIKPFPSWITPEIQHKLKEYGFAFRYIPNLELDAEDSRKALRAI